MPRLIDATPIETDLDAKVRKNAGRNISIIGLADALARIYAAPTVDAVPVVRCKDCAWYNELDRCVNPKCVKSYYGAPVPPEHFCSYGERRSGNNAPAG